MLLLASLPCMHLLLKDSVVGRTVNCINPKAEQRPGESWNVMEVRITRGGCHVPRNMGGSGSGRNKLGGLVWGRDWTSAELQGLVHACLLPVQPGFMPQVTVGFTGQLTFFHFLCPLTTSITMAPVLAPAELVYSCSCFICIKEKRREGFCVWISSNYCASQVNLTLFFLSSCSTKFKKGQTFLASWKWVWS